MNKKILFLYSSGLYAALSNFNSYQRVFFLSKKVQVTYIIKKNEKISDKMDNLTVVRSPFSSSIFHLFYCIYWSILNNKKFQLIISDNSYLIISAFIIKFLFKTKIVFDIWDIPFRELKLTFLSKLKRKLKVFLFRPFFQKADLYIISIDPNLQLREFRLPSKKIRCFLNAIPITALIKKKPLEHFNAFTILIQRSHFYTGFGIELMLDVFKLILNQIDAKLLIIGRISPEVQIKIQQFEFKNKIITTGFIKHDEFIELALKSHICMIPFPKSIDLEQTYPIKAIEFMALGKAIIASNLTGISKMITHEKNGILVEPVTANKFAEAIIDLYRNPDKRQKLAFQARIDAQQFDARLKNEKIFREIEKLVTPSK